MSLFALTFGLPGLLWGAGLASAPLIIHLLHRRRFREMEWAAMKWLMTAIRKNYRRLRLEQLLLLLIRTLVILLVVLAMAKPSTETAGALQFDINPATHNIIVFDNSMSMHYQVAGNSRWVRAKGIAQSILDNSRTGDLASVVVLGTPTRVLVEDSSPYRTAVSEEIAGISPQHGSARLEPGIDRVLEILHRSRASNKHVYLITDMQRSTWIAESGMRNAEWGKEKEESAFAIPHSAFDDLGRKLLKVNEQADNFSILDVSSPQSPNLAIVGIEQIAPLVVLGHLTVIRATVANFSKKNRSDVRVELLVDGQVESVQRVSLPAGELSSINFSLSFHEPGNRVAEVRVGDEWLRPDNRRYLVVRVRQSLEVLLVDGQAAGEPFESETDYLQVALAPEPESGAGTLIHTDYRLESDLLDLSLDDWDMVALCNVGQLSASEVSVLEEYLQRGGGVLFFLGSQTNLEAYNRLLFEEGKGLFPLKLTDFLGNANPPKDSDDSFGFDPLDYAHSIIAPFDDAQPAGLLTTKIYRFVKAELPEDSLASVVLAYQTGDPALVIWSYRRGRVAVVTTSADIDWNNWAISPSYLPVIQELTRHLVAGRVGRPAVLVGEPLSLPAPLQGDEVTATVTPPIPDSSVETGSDSDSAVAVDLGNPVTNGSFRYDETDLAGIYHVRFGEPSGEEHFLAVNTWPTESDLSKLLADDLVSMYPGWEFSLLDRWQSEANGGSKPPPIPLPQKRGDLHRLLLYLALGLLFTETFLAWKFGYQKS